MSLQFNIEGSFHCDKTRAKGRFFKKRCCQPSYIDNSYLTSYVAVAHRRQRAAWTTSDKFDGKIIEKPPTLLLQDIHFCVNADIIVCIVCC